MTSFYFIGEMMAKVILEFDPDTEQEQLEQALNAGKAYSTIHSIKEYIRRTRKYTHAEFLDKEEVMKELNEILNEQT